MPKLLNLVSLKGEDIMVQAPTEETLRYHRLRASLPASLWTWKTVMGWPWRGSPEHINVLELRAVLTSLRWRIVKKHAIRSKFAQRLPRKVRLLLFGADHYELDISGAHYELTRRYCAVAGVHLSLQPVRVVREWLRGAFNAPETTGDPALIDAFVERWPLVIINSSTPQEAVSYIQRQLLHLRDQLPAQLVRFAYELHAASRYVIDNPPAWCPIRNIERSRATPFRFYEHLEQQLTWAAYAFLQPLVGFRSVI